MLRLILALMLTMGSAVAQVALPPDTLLQAPGADVPAAFARFAGAWGDAAWDGVLPTGLVVEHVAADGQVRAVYAVGDAATLGIRGQSVRLSGSIVEGRLSLIGRPGLTLAFDWTSDGLAGRYVTAEGWRSNALLRRLPELAAIAQPVRVLWEDVRVPVRTDAGTVLLQGFWYPSARSGRRPALVFNHGSTDGERPGVPAIYPAETVARFLRARGWSVLVPMRKGRGLSGGAMQEPSDRTVPEQAQVESGIMDVDAAVDWLRGRTDIDPARIVVAGQSRGGILSLAYAGRHPGKVSAVVNFAGGWWSERSDIGFDAALARAAGETAHMPALWLYADHDSYYRLPFVRAMFAAFELAGGRGTLRTYDGLKQGHGLLNWPELWRADLVQFLAPFE